MMDNYFCSTIHDSYVIFSDISVNRALELAELVQYSVIYTVIFIIAGRLVDDLFPIPKTKDKFLILIEIVLQTTMAVLVLFYLRLAIKMVPFILGDYDGYEPGETSEFEGEFCLGIIYIAVQFNLFNKILIFSGKHPTIG